METNMAEFWETSFKEKQEMWGWDPADSARRALELFKDNGFTKILVPGFGYGRNAKVFIENNFAVTGIEISETAVEIANKEFDGKVKVYHGNVSLMPFDDNEYDGIFCYALIHLLSESERAKLLSDCYNQLRKNGYMVFVTISKNDFRFGNGKIIGEDLFEVWPGLNLFFYDINSINSEFSRYGLVEAKEIYEPENTQVDKPSQRFWNIICKK